MDLTKLWDAVIGGTTTTVAPTTTTVTAPTSSTWIYAVLGVVLVFGVIWYFYPKH